MAQQAPTILQIIPRLDTGGAELSTIEIAEAIVRAGGRALVATEGGRMADRIAAVGGEIITMPVDSKNPATLLANARRLAGLVRTRGVALLHARSRAPAWSALIAARRTGVDGAVGTKIGESLAEFAATCSAQVRSSLVTTGTGSSRMALRTSRSS